MKHYLLRSLRIEIPDQTLIPYLKLSEPPEATPLEQAIIPSSTGAWERGSSYVSDKLAIGGIVLVLTTLPQLPYLDEEILNALTLLTLCTLPEEVTPKIDYRIDEGIVWSERIRESITTAKNNGMIESMDQIKITEIGLFTIQNMLGANGALKEHLLKSAINLMETARNKPHILLQAAVAFAMSSPAPNPEAQAILDYLSPQIQNRNFTCIR